MAQQFTSVILTIFVKTYRLHPLSLLLSHRIKRRFVLPNLCTIQAARKYCFDIISNNDECDNKEIDEKYTNLYKDKNQALVNTISTILSINTNEATKLLRTFHETKRLSEDEIINIITTVKKANISLPTIQNNIPTLVQNMNSLSTKIDYIMYLNDNMDEMFPLLNVDSKYLNLLTLDEIPTEHSEDKNKIRYLANKLKCNVYKLCEAIVQEPIIITLSFNRIKIVVDILEEYNYDPRDILNSLWLFKYSPKTIHRRSLTVKLAGIHTVKCWIIRCSLKGLQRYISALKKESRVNIYYGSHVSLLSKKLNIPEEEVKFYIKRHSDILEIQLDKVNEVLDILLKYGYGPEQILSCQRVFLMKTSVLEERLEMLHNLRGKCRLTLVYCSKKVFDDIIKHSNKLCNI